MDLERLKKLERLAGLRVAPEEREALLADLVALEELAGALPGADPTANGPEGSATGSSGDRAPVPHEPDRARENAPDFREGFFHTPPPVRGDGQE